MIAPVGADEGRPRSILVVCPETGEGAYFDRAATLARALRARLRLVDVVPLSGDEPAALRRRVDRVVAARLAERLAGACSAGVAVSGRVLHGKPFVEIIREVVRGGHDLVMVPSDLRRGLREAPFGSTTLHLLRKCPVPVWAVRRPSAGRGGPVVAAVALDADGPPGELDARIVGLAAMVARAEGAELEVVHCWEVPFAGTLWRAGYGRGTSIVRSLRHETRGAQARRLEDLLASVHLGSLTVRTRLVHGEADDALPRIAGRRRAGLVVMGTIARVGLAGVFTGNTAERMLHRLGCSILAVKPEGFVTPVA